tara:strand:+ start:237 stop:674 length:438 start_codon:yes stop_codon:yes gene_type:complete
VATIKLAKGAKAQTVVIRGEQIELTQDALEISPTDACSYLGVSTVNINFTGSDKELLKDAAPAHIRHLSKEFRTEPNIDDILQKMFPSKKPTVVKKAEKAVKSMTSESKPVKKEVKPKPEIKEEKPLPALKKEILTDDKKDKTDA